VCVCALTVGSHGQDLAQKHSVRSLEIAGRWGQPVMAVCVCVCVVRGSVRWEVKTRTWRGCCLQRGRGRGIMSSARKLTLLLPAHTHTHTHTHTHGQWYKLKSAGCGNERQVHWEAVGVTGRENERGQKEHVKVKAGGRRRKQTFAGCVCVCVCVCACVCMCVCASAPVICVVNAL